MLNLIGNSQTEQDHLYLDLAIHQHLLLQVLSACCHSRKILEHRRPCSLVLAQAGIQFLKLCLPLLLLSPARFTCPDS